VLATRLGAAAAEALARGERGIMVGWERSRALSTPLEQAVAFQKEVNLELCELAEVMEL
jgi:6-phosphofructokinase